MLDGLIPPLLVLAFALTLFAARRSYLRSRPRHRIRADLVIILVVLAFSGFLEVEMGRTPTYKHGPVRLWSGDTHSDQNSQQIADPYSFTHLVHGAVLYAVFRAALPASPPSLRLAMAITAESAWEVLENTDMVINRYRAETISLDYYGDSIVNSMSDILVCALGFCLAKRLPTWVTVCSVLALEVILALWIRDNLTLNILMLIHPVRFIRTWQAGA